MNKSVTDGMNNGRQTIWNKVFTLALIAIMMIAIIFEMVPSLMKHNMHNLPNGFLGISIILRLISKLLEGNASDRIINFISAMMVISLIGFIISKLILEGPHALNLLMVL